MILLIDNYDSFTYNIYQQMAALGARCKVVRNDKVSIDEIKRMKPSGVVISPGPGRPEEAGVSVDVIKVLGDRIPILGVCLGHQAIATAFGGSVVRARRLMHGKTSRIRHTGRGLFKGMAPEIEVGRYHSLVISRKDLPSCLEVTSETEDGTIMGVRHRRYPVEGLQFHPESVLTPNGPGLLQKFLIKIGEIQK